jgi:hypothetical protein
MDIKFILDMHNIRIFENCWATKNKK